MNTQNTPATAAQSAGLSYRDAGVDIVAGDQLVENIKPFAKRTLRPEVLSGIGGFGGLVEISKKYKEPVLVSGTDGVGTKLKLAFELDIHDTVGIDLVGMSVNDILVQGAEPLFFLDYFACGKLDVTAATEVIKGIAAGCEQAGCALIGGETAEMPGMYPVGEYDLAGFAVGVVEKAHIITGADIAPGDVVLGLASNGAHSNGYSLVRKILERSQPDLAAKFDGELFEVKNQAFYDQYKAGTLDIHEFLDFQLKPLSRHPHTTLDEWHGQFMREAILPMIGQPARDLVRQHQASGDLCVVITATNSFITAPIAREFGIEHLIATEPEQRGGEFTGAVAGIPSFKEGKIIRLENWLSDRGWTLEGFNESTFYSDSMNDLPLLRKVSHPVAANPDDTLRRHAEQHGWPIIALH